MMPNWSWQLLHFSHTLALGLWVGGIVAIGALAAPALFGSLSSPGEAGRVMGRILRRFDALVGGCIVVLALTSAVMIVQLGRFSAWYAIEYTCIAMMSASAIYSARFISPRIRVLRQEGRADSEEFSRLHRTSVLAMQFNLACGTVAMFFT